MIDELIASDAYKNGIEVYFCSENKDTLVKLLNIVIELADKSQLPDCFRGDSVAKDYRFVAMANSTKVKPAPEIVKSVLPSVRIMKGDLTEQKVGAIVNTVGKKNSVQGPLF